MLVVVLILMVVGFGALLAGSLTGTLMWGWVAVAASVVGAAVLVASWRHRSAMRTDAERFALEAPSTPGILQPAAPTTQWEPTTHAAATTAAPGPQPQVPEEPVTEALRPARVNTAEPSGRQSGEERATPADLAYVAGLDRQVLVVDEQPGYHLAGCPVLSGRVVVGLPAKEAVALDFTPCAVCTPVRVLASAGSRLEHSSGNQA